MCDQRSNEQAQPVDSEWNKGKGKGEGREAEGMGRGRRFKGGRRAANSKIPTSCARDLKYPRYPPAGPGLSYTYNLHSLTHTHNTHSPNTFFSPTLPPSLHSCRLTHPLSTTQLFGRPLVLDTCDPHPLDSYRGNRRRSTDRPSISTHH